MSAASTSAPASPGAVAVVGTGVGPVLAGAWFDLSGTYYPAFIAAIAVYMTAAVVIGVSREPRPG